MILLEAEEYKNVTSLPQSTLDPNLRGNRDQSLPSSSLLIMFLGQSKVSFFENGSNFAVNNSVMGENIHITQTQTTAGEFKHVNARTKAH